jgi:uncharacterized protein YndB with AHSA1/START domain
VTAIHARQNAAEEATASEFVMARVFDAPRALLWAAFTEAERLRHWWGPKGFTVRHCELDLRPGGIFHYGLRSADGKDMWGRFVYREIVPPERLVFIVSFSDEAGNVTRHPWNPDWPLQMLSTVSFTEQDGRTTVTVRWVPHAATELERKTFEAGRESMRQGWTGTLDQLTEYLASAESLESRSRA